MSKRASLLAITSGLLLAAAGCEAPQGAAAAQTGATRPTPSGLPVPRWVTLKFGEVNARGGPGDDHRKLWVYRVKGLPVQVVAETKDWRRICDGEGGLSWVHKRVVDGKRNVLNLSGAPVPLHAKERADSPARAYLAVGAMAAVDRCKGEWCRVEAGSVKGWAPPGQLWGTVETPLCKAKRRR